jgi:hypothetical protein
MRSLFWTMNLIFGFSLQAKRPFAQSAGGGRLSDIWLKAVAFESCVGSAHKAELMHHGVY